MKIRGLDENDDWTFGKGLEDYKTKSEAINQDVKTAILEWKGDCFFANNNGIDWNNRLEKRQQKRLESEIKSLISKREGIIQVNQISSSLSENRVLTITYEITTIYSETIKDSVEVA
jgi:hypothetical protein